jgi:gamma-glutamylcyclotransferase (GGCT)/AIG2-like uncharacterized protein YtfP
VSTNVFVYGTLKPGQHRWPTLAPFASGEQAAVSASAPGRLFDTGYGWPAAVFDPRAADLVPGVVVALHPASADEALSVLDDVEGVDSGLFRRVLVDVEGRRCWAYHWPGKTEGFRRIAHWQ